ncbi:MAG: hypothetical protein RLZZ142_1288, partial [Verrucomicrobiota bacterium]
GILRRHFAGFDGVDHLGPEGVLGEDGGILFEAFEVDSALGFLPAVAVEAGGLKGWEKGFPSGFWYREGGEGGEGEGGGQSAEEQGQPRALGGRAEAGHGRERAGGAKEEIFRREFS